MERNQYKSTVVTDSVIFTLTALLLTVLVGLIPSVAHGQDTLRLSVDDCRRMAADSSLLLRKADLQVQAARLDRRQALAAYLPKVDGSFSALYMSPDIDLMGTNLVLKGTWLAGLSLQQPVFAGGRIVAANRLASLGADCAGLQQRKTRAEVVAEAEQAFWAYLSVQQKMRTVEAGIALMDSVLSTVTVSLSSRLATEADLLSVQARQAELRYQQAQCRTGLELCRLALCNAIGVDWDTPIEIFSGEGGARSENWQERSGELLAPPSSLLAGIDSLPDLLLLQKNVEVKRQQQRMALAELLPTVGIGAGYTYASNIKVEGTADYQGMQVPYSQSYDQGMAYAMLSVSVPLWDWGATPAKYRKARLETQSAELDLEHNRRLLRLRAEQAGRSLADAWLRMEAVTLAERSARENLRVATDKHRAAMLTTNELLECHTKWQQAVSDLVEAQADLQVLASQWRLATGQY